MIKPEDTLKLTPADDKRIAECEQVIDAGLTARTSKEFVATFSPPLRVAAAEELKRRYVTAGWSVSYGLRDVPSGGSSTREVTRFEVSSKS